ncbi:DNA ligase 1 [Herpailurus yagouaroundi]|uniref:DNA ligase 1 n=1 Tax=Herpailurus yagouaroundi TaxID=1608482 RepID=UPI001AD76CD7|nr:DNA ligase 1 [Puma yagouaroundi]
MQRSIMSFFHPKKEGKAKKPEKETSSRETEPPPKVALKEWNGEVPENDSPVKRPGRKAARVLGSEGEEEDEALTPSKGQKPAPGSPQVSPPSPVTFPEDSPPLSNTSPAGLSPTGIPKRRTARKQLPKRPIQDILEEQSKDEDREAKRKKEEAEIPSLSQARPGAGSGERWGRLAGQEEAGSSPRAPDTHWPAPPQSTAKKMDVIKGLFVACRHSEARFIARALSGRLRLGLAEQSVLAALAQAVSLTPPGQDFPPAVVDAGKGRTAEARKTWLEEQGMILKQTFCEVPDLDRIIPVLLEHGLERLPEHCRLSPGVPLKPMLAHPTRGVGEVLKRFEEAAFTCEYKYDGQRAQIHVLEGGEVKIFSRNQEDNTGKYPDIIGRIPKIKLPSVTSFILDTEAVAWDREKKQIQPFQVLTTRKRKEVDAADIQVQVCLYAFDLIYLNGESLVREPLSRRRQLLRENFVQTEGEFVFATSLDTKDTDQIAEFLEQSVKDSCEGLMVKTLDVDATYEIAKRSHNWLKLKKDYLDGVGDTLDLVVIGAYLGRGKRAGRYGGFLLAAYDEESEELQAICKLGTGFSDEELEDHFQSLQALVLPTPRSYVRADGAVAPDHWLDPSAVWEVKCADLSLSPIYPAARGLVDSEKGISLRFPRFIRVREDKKPEEATTSAQVASLYKKQSQIQNQQGADLDSDPEDFY